MEIYGDKGISDVKIICPKLLGDQRGWFLETYREDLLRESGVNAQFIQDNHSYSANANTVRGLHFQVGEFAQAKLVRCTRGSIFDVAVDLRKHSETFGRWVGEVLSSDNRKQLFIPKGFAHGFMTMTDDVEVQYKVDAPYSAEHDRSLKWNDEHLSISWPKLGTIEIVLSDKDRAAPSFTTYFENEIL